MMYRIRNRGKALLTLSLVTVVAAVGLGSVAAADVATKKKKLDPIKITYATTANNSVSAVAYVAKDHGLFTKAGLEVEILNPAPATLVPGLVGGSFTVVQGPLAGTSAAMVRGEKLVATAPVLDSDLSIIVNNARVNVADVKKPFPDNIKALKGKKIGIPGFGTSVQAFLESMFKEAGLDLYTYTTVISTGGASTATGPALANGALDATVGSYGTYLVLKTQGLSLTEVAANRKGQAGTANKPGSVVSTTGVWQKSYLDSNPETFKRWCTAISNTIKFMENPANRSKVAKTIETLAKLQPTEAFALWDETNDTFHFDSFTTKEVWDTQATFNVKGDASKIPFDQFHKACPTAKAK